MKQDSDVPLFTIAVLTPDQDRAASVLSLVRYHNVVTRGVHGLWITCGASLSPRSTNLSSEECDPDATTVASSDTAAPSFTRINFDGRDPWVRFAAGRELADAFLETHRHAAYKGGGMVFGRMEGGTVNATDKIAYSAMSAIGSSTKAHAGVDGVINAGAVYALPMQGCRTDTDGAAIDSDRVQVRTGARVELTGQSLAMPLAPGDTAYPDRIANPDNPKLSQTLRTLFIGEESGMHVYHVLRACKVGTKKPSRILSRPAGAESTGLHAGDDINGFACVKSNFQHAGDRESIAATVQPAWTRLCAPAEPAKPCEAVGQPSAPGVFPPIPAGTPIAKFHGSRPHTRGARRMSLSRRTTLGIALAATATLSGLPGAAFAQGKLKVAAIYTVPVEQQWVSRIDKALKAAVARGEIEYVFSENVANADYERVMRQYAEAGHTLIVGEAFAVEAAARKVAKDYPKTAFLLGSSGKPQAPNFSVFDNYIQEPAYLTGLIAGGLSKSGKIGMVGGYPIPEVNRLMNAFMAGVKEMNPKAEFMLTFINSWFDPPKAKEAAFAMIDKGADVMYAERFGVSDAAKERKVLAIGNVIDTQAQYPDTVVASALWHMEPTIDAAIKAVKAGTFKAEDYGHYSMMKPGGSSLAPLGSFEGKVPKAVMDKVAARQKEILAGSFKVKVDDNPPKAK